MTARLLAEAGVGPSADVTLPHAYEEAVEELGAAQVVTLLRQLYADTTPLEWHRRLSELPWEAIWTFNIDDVIETAYRTTPSAAQRISIHLWDDRPQPFGGVTSQVPIVHLHGYVGNIEPRAEPKLIFGVAEYLSALRARPGNWQTRFSSEFLDKPVIIVGARMSDELDFGEIIRSGNVSRDYGSPSLIVVQSATAINRRQYERWGLTLVEAPAEVFFEYLIEEIRNRATALPTTRYTSRYTERTFQVLAKLAEDEVPSSGHDFYGGQTPEWIDILGDLDATPRLAREIVDRIGTPAEAGDGLQQLWLLLGPPFTGKSTAMLRIGRGLQLRGWEPTYLCGLDRLQTHESLEYFKDRPNAVLLVEDIHYDITDIIALLSAAEAKGQRLLVLGTDRQNFERRIILTTPKDVLPDGKGNWFRPPSDSLWDQILQRRREHARLGRLEGCPRLVTQKHFVDNRKDLFSSLATLEDAAGFISRGLEAITSIDLQFRRAFSATALTGWLGLPIPSSVVAGVSGLTIRQLLDTVQPDGPLSSWVEFGGGHLRLRHRYLGDLLVQRSTDPDSSQQLLNLAQQICLLLADRVGIEAMRERKLEARIVGALMDETTLHTISPKSDLDEWYAGLEESYRWNARLWEQWALSLSDYDRAYSYARRAVEKLNDSLTHNTLGVVQMRRSLRALGVKTPGTWQEYWGDANVQLKESRRLGHGTFEYPYITYLTHTVQIARKAAGRDPKWDKEAQSSTREWLEQVKKHGVLKDRRSRDLLDAVPPTLR